MHIGIKFLQYRIKSLELILVSLPITFSITSSITDYYSYILLFWKSSISRLIIVSHEVKKKQAVRDERASELFTGSTPLKLVSKRSK